MSTKNIHPQASDVLSPAKAAESPPGSVINAAIRNYLRAVAQVGQDAEEDYQRALKDLRRDPEATIVELAAAYGCAHARDYPVRWALIFAADELKHPAALAFLKYIVETPIPREPREPSHGFSIVGEETILRTTAIDGIGHLAAHGNETATEVLLQALKQPSVSMRRAAVQALRGTRRFKKLSERIRAELPPDQHFLLKLSTPKLNQVPQVSNPRRFLSDRARSAKTEPAPRLPGSSESSNPPGKK